MNCGVLSFILSEIRKKILRVITEEIRYRISSVITRRFSLPNQVQKFISILKDGSRSLILFRRERFIAEFHNTDLNKGSSRDGNPVL